MKSVEYVVYTAPWFKTYSQLSHTQQHKQLVNVPQLTMMQNLINTIERDVRRRSHKKPAPEKTLDRIKSVTDNHNEPEELNLEFN